MKALSRLLIAGLFAILAASIAAAQQATLQNCTVVSSAPTYTAGTQRPCTQDTSGNQRVSVGPASGTTVLSGGAVVTGSASSATTLSNFPVDVSVGYQAASVQFTSVGSGNTVMFEGSNDNSNWIQLCANYTNLSATNLSCSGLVGPSTANAVDIPLAYRYFRVRISTYGSGTVTAVAFMSPVRPQVQRVEIVPWSNGTGKIGSVDGTVASGSADSGSPVKVGGRYNSTKPTFADGQRGDLQVGTRGSMMVQLQDPDGTSGGTITAASDTLSDTFGGLYTNSRKHSFGGTNWARDFTCSNSAVINVSAAATTQIVALASSQVIRVCSFVISGDTLATTATFVYGTGANCGTGTTSLTGAMRLQDEGNISATGMNGSLFRTAASNALCLTAATGAVTGFVTYAQY
jgi:hypothetical protein